jgi:protein-disulfide isomerase
MSRRSIDKIYARLLLAAMALACVPSLAPAQEIQLITLAGQKAMLAAPGVEPAGSKNPDVTIVEYFDFNCPYCKRFSRTLEALIAEDSKVAIVYKDWPILGDASVYASKSALAAGWQGKYLIAHDALINGPRVAQNAQVDAILQRAGVNLDVLNKDRTAHAADIDALLVRNDAEAHALSLGGTPGLVVGREILPGIVDLKNLRILVADARHAQ